MSQSITPNKSDTYNNTNGSVTQLSQGNQRRVGSIASQKDLSLIPTPACPSTAPFSLLSTITKNTWLSIKKCKKIETS
jgi:hypothetical protein